MINENDIYLCHFIFYQTFLVIGQKESNFCSIKDIYIAKPLYIYIKIFGYKEMIG